jgi:phosphate transport system substrate-binding protein
LRLNLAGAQIPVEMVASWLGDSKEPVFVTEQIQPVFMSQHGFESLVAGRCDLACTDRPITARELEKFGDRPVHGQRVAFFGYALYVNASNPLDSIFSKHVRLVFQKRIRDWSELVGEQIPQLQGPISLYGPEKSTRAGMVLSPLARIWFADASRKVLGTDKAIVDAVADDPLGLGFASIGYDDERVRYLGLRMERQSPPAFPSLEEIESERYGLAKLIYVYYTEPASPAVQAALDYLFGDAGARAIESTDMWPVSPERSTVPAPS